MSRLVLALSLCVTASWLVACNSSTEMVTSPSVSKCAATITATPTSFPAAGGTGTLSVSTSRECQWTATTIGAWIHLGDSATGQGDASTSFSITKNADPAVREGTISVGEQRVGLTQEAALCVFTIDPHADSVSAGGGQRTVAVTASSPACAWTARSDVDWLTVVDGAQGTGNGQVRYEAGGTSGPARRGTLVIAGGEIVIAQGSGCA